jgi:hypothetical protein
MSTLNEQWPGTFQYRQATHKTTNEEQTTSDDLWEHTRWQYDGTGLLNFPLIMEAGVPKGHGEAKKLRQETLNGKRTIWCVSFTSHKELSLTMFKFNELRQLHKACHQPERHLATFATDLELLLREELQTETNHDTGTRMQDKNFWSTDRTLLQLLISTYHLTVERFSSAVNRHPGLQEAYSARTRDGDFGSKYDALMDHENPGGRPIHRKFTDGFGYCNPEYETKMMLETLARCTEALESPEPARNVMFVPFHSGHEVWRAIREQQQNRPQDVRVVANMPSGTYPFTRYKFWFAKDTVSKRVNDTYKDGHLGIIVIDNAAARKAHPPEKGHEAEWKRWMSFKLPQPEAGKITWYEELEDLNEIARGIAAHNARKAHNKKFNTHQGSTQSGMEGANSEQDDAEEHSLIPEYIRTIYETMCRAEISTTQRCVAILAEEPSSRLKRLLEHAGLTESAGLTMCLQVAKINAKYVTEIWKQRMDSTPRHGHLDLWAPPAPRKELSSWGKAPQNTSLGNVPLTQNAHSAKPMYTTPTSRTDETYSRSLPPRAKPGARERLGLTARANWKCRDRAAQVEEGRATNYVARYLNRIRDPMMYHKCHRCDIAPGARKWTDHGGGILCAACRSTVEKAKSMTWPDGWHRNLNNLPHRPACHDCGTHDKTVLEGGHTKEIPQAHENPRQLHAAAGVRTVPVCKICHFGTHPSLRVELSDATLRATAAPARVECGYCGTQRAQQACKMRHRIHLCITCYSSKTNMPIRMLTLNLRGKLRANGMTTGTKNEENGRQSHIEKALLYMHDNNLQPEATVVAFLKAECETTTPTNTQNTDMENWANLGPGNAYTWNIRHHARLETPVRNNAAGINHYTRWAGVTHTPRTQPEANPTGILNPSRSTTPATDHHQAHQPTDAAVPGSPNRPPEAATVPGTSDPAADTRSELCKNNIRSDDDDTQAAADLAGIDTIIGPNTRPPNPTASPQATVTQTESESTAAPRLAIPSQPSAIGNGSTAAPGVNRGTGDVPFNPG